MKQSQFTCICSILMMSVYYLARIAEASEAKGFWIGSMLLAFLSIYESRKEWMAIKEDQ